MPGVSRKRLSILAGGGALVNQTLQAALAKGWTVQILKLVDRVDLRDTPQSSVSLSRPIELIWRIRQFRSSHACMVGHLRVSDKGREELGRFTSPLPVRRAPMGDAALSVAVRALEIFGGVKLLGVQDIVPDMLATDGVMAGPALPRRTISDCRYALEIARQIGRLDIGQAAVCSGQRVIAVEDIGGTDALLDRVAAFRAEGQVGDGKTPLVLAKAVKPQQPRYVDLPAVGPDTVTAAAGAGVSVIAVETGRALVIEREEMTRRAEAKGISLVGVTLDDG